jgi:hypothetical protein
MMKIISTIALLGFIQVLLPSCKDKGPGQEAQQPIISVKVTPVRQGNIEDYINLNGKTIYLEKNKIVAPISAYVTKVNVQYGDFVKKGDVLFELETRESRALDSSMGTIKVLALTGGTIIEQMINETGAYMVEGDPLCTIVEKKDLMVQVNFPYEYNSLLITGKKCNIVLTDHTSFNGTIINVIPHISEKDQTQTVLIKPNTERKLPENLNLTVQFILNTHNHTLLIPKGAVMTNEKQSDFWVMKLVNDSLAVKVPVQKGIENDSTVEIISSVLNNNDLIINEGAYGLPDSSLVQVIK